MKQELAPILLKVQQLLLKGDYHELKKLIEDNPYNGSEMTNNLKILPFLEEKLNIISSALDLFLGYYEYPELSRTIKLFNLIIRDIDITNFYGLDLEDQVNIINLYYSIKEKSVSRNEYYLDGQKLDQKLNLIISNIENTFESDDFRKNKFLCERSFSQYMPKVCLLLAMKNQDIIKNLMNSVKIKAKILSIIRSTQNGHLINHKNIKIFWNDFDIVDNFASYLNEEEWTSHSVMIISKAIEHLNVGIINRIFSHFNKTKETKYTMSVEKINIHNFLPILTMSLAKKESINNISQECIDFFKNICHIPGININVQRDGDHSTALIFAAKYGSMKIMQLLMEKKPNLNIRDSKGKTALMYAVKKRNLEIPKSLIDNGADINIKDHNGKCVVRNAISAENIEFLLFLIKTNTIDINNYNLQGQTMLTTAALLGCVNVVKLLIENGVNVSAVNNFGDNALKLANSEGYLEIVKLIQEKMSEVKVSTKSNNLSIMEIRSNVVIEVDEIIHSIMTPIIKKESLQADKCNSL